MAIETPNPEALARMALNNPPVMTRSVGLLPTINRLSAGNYEIGCEQPLDILEGVGHLQVAQNLGVMTAVRIRDYATFGPRNILLQTFDAAGAAVEGGNVLLTLFRFPRTD